MYCIFINKFIKILPQGFPYSLATNAPCYNIPPIFHYYFNKLNFNYI